MLELFINKSEKSTKILVGIAGHSTRDFRNAAQSKTLCENNVRFGSAILEIGGCQLI
jgi:hypothetical protein